MGLIHGNLTWDSYMVILGGNLRWDSYMGILHGYLMWDSYVGLLHWTLTWDSYVGIGNHSSTMSRMIGIDAGGVVVGGGIVGTGSAAWSIRLGGGTWNCKVDMISVNRIVDVSDRVELFSLVCSHCGWITFFCQQ